MNQENGKYQLRRLKDTQFEGFCIWRWFIQSPVAAGFEESALAGDYQGLAGLKRIRIQVVPGQQLVKIGAVSFCESRRLADIAHGDLQNL